MDFVSDFVHIWVKDISLKGMVNFKDTVPLNTIFTVLITVILTPRETLSLFSFPLSTLLHFENFKKIYEIFPKNFLEIQTIKKNLTRVSKCSLIGLGLTVVWLNR